MPKTGETCHQTGIYRFAGHTDRSVGCHPTSEEHEIPLSNGETFPPIRSCGKGVFWQFIRYA